MPTWGIFATVAGVVILAGLLAGLVSLFAFKMLICIQTFASCLTAEM